MRNGLDPTFSSIVLTADTAASIAANQEVGSAGLVDQAKLHLPALHEFTPASLMALFDVMSLGALLVTPSGQVLHSNPAACDAMASSSVLSVKDGQLLADSTPHQKALLTALVSASQGLSSLLSLSGSGSAGRGGLLVSVVPSARQRLLGCAPTALLPVALFFQRPAICDASMFLLFARKFGLTPTEQQVLTFLCRSWSTPEIATELNVAVSTIRSHVRSMCCKTSSKGSRELINRMAMLPPAGSTSRLQMH